MTKFIIEKINIEKSNKDIPTGVLYELSSGLNLICGNNEAGKSSLMKFIKEGFFRSSKTDNGKIFFSVNNKQYRADIKNSNKKAERCRIYNNNGTEAGYEIIEKFINQKYFEQGFTINLDDVMNLKYDNEISLVNVIKDPSGDKLNSFLAPLISKLAEYTGDKNKPRQAIKDIVNRISELNLKINELANKESEYINADTVIKQCESDIKKLNEQKVYINSLIKKRDNDKKINEILSQIQEKNLEFNSGLYEKREEYNALTLNIIRYESNLENIARLKQKIENINIQIKELEQKLQNNFDICIENSEISDFDIDYKKITEIRNLTENINNKTAEIKAYEKTIEDLNENLLKLENDYNFVKKDIKNLSKDEADKLYQDLDNGLKQIKSLESEINELKEGKSQNGIVIFEKLIAGLTAVIAILLSAYFFSLNKAAYASVFAGLCLFSTTLILTMARKNDLKQQIERKQFLKENIIKELNNSVQIFDPQISEYNGIFAISKLDEIRQEIKRVNDIIIQNTVDSEFNRTKINNIQEKINTLKSGMETTKQTIKNLMARNITDDSRIYLDAINIIKDLKNEVKNKTDFEKELLKTEQDNTLIINLFNTFLKESEINLNISTNIKENFEKLIKYNERNNEIKKETDALNMLLENIKNDENNIPYIEQMPEITASSDLNYILDDIEVKIKNTLDLKHNAMVQKSRLEEVESIVDLKNERNIAINDYRNHIEEIITARTIENIITAAKNNFDKTRPDLVNAQKYLSLLTNGKYSEINLELQEISDSSKVNIKKWEELSRGTKEQLYLALRLGYASNYTIKDNKRPDLPLIIDDAFVNFDAERTKSALKCLIEFSRTNQVLFFTCHTTAIKEQLKELGYCEDINIINL